MQIFSYSFSRFLYRFLAFIEAVCLRFLFVCWRQGHKNQVIKVNFLNGQFIGDVKYFVKGGDSWS